MICNNCKENIKRTGQNTTIKNNRLISLASGLLEFDLLVFCPYCGKTLKYESSTFLTSPEIIKYTLCDSIQELKKFIGDLGFYEKG